MSILVRSPRLFSSMPTLFSDFFDDDNKLLNFNGDGWASKVPAANIQEKEAEYVIELAAPGMEKKIFM